MKFHNIGTPKDKIADFCRKWKVVELALFGSVLRDDFGPDSDEYQLTYEHLLSHVEEKCDCRPMLMI